MVAFHAAQSPSQCGELGGGALSHALSGVVSDRRRATASTITPASKSIAAPGAAVKWEVCSGPSLRPNVELHADTGKPGWPCKALAGGFIASLAEICLSRHRLVKHSFEPPTAFGKDRFMSTAPSSIKPPAVLHDIDWGTYTRLLRVFERRRGFRLTFDRGTLEIMSPLWEHEKAAYILGTFVDVITQELQLPYEPGRSVTLRRRRKNRGLEPDNCY